MTRRIISLREFLRRHAEANPLTVFFMASVGFLFMVTWVIIVLVGVIA